MALIKCSECGKRISDKAAACPHCGCPVVYNAAGSGQTPAESHKTDTKNDKDFYTIEYSSSSSGNKAVLRKPVKKKRLFILIGIAAVLLAVLLALLLKPTFSILGTWTNDSKSYTFNIDGSVVKNGTNAFGAFTRNGRYSVFPDGTLTIEWNDDASSKVFELSNNAKYTFSSSELWYVESNTLYLGGISYQKS